MSAKQAKSNKRIAYMSTIESDINDALRRRSVLPTQSDIPTPFTNFQSFSEEWNLCGKYDSSRRVNVVADLKLQRKRMPHLLVDKCVKARASESMLLFLVRYSELTVGFSHPNIVQLRGYYSCRRKIHLFVDFCELGSLKRAYILEPNPLLRLHFAPLEREVRDAMRQICSSVAFLHANGIAHGDLALENVFMTSRSVLKIGDLDHAVFVGTENRKQPRTRNEPLRRIYGAPELYATASTESRPVDLLQADVWALGVVLIELVTKKPLLDSAAPHDKGFQLLQRIGLRAYLRAMYLEQKAICTFSDAMLDLLDGLLQVDPTKRLSPAEAMASGWLQCSGRADEHDANTNETE